MQATIPSLAATRDLFLVIAAATAFAGGAAAAAGLAMPEMGPPPIHPLAFATGSAQAEQPSRFFPTTCLCDDPARPSNAPPATTTRPNESPLPALAAQASEWPYAPEAGSFAAWARADTDPRQILAKLAALSRRAPRSHTSEPPS